MFSGCQGDPTHEPPADGLPPLEWEGARVVLGTDLVDKVCVGTLERLDLAVESIEAALELEPSTEQIEVFVLDTDAFEAACGSWALACTGSTGVVYLSRTALEKSGRHELVHARLIQEGITGKPLFSEGIARALEPGGNCLASDKCSTADLEDLLLAETSRQLSDADGYDAGADLVHGMLVTYGPEAVLSFMGDLPLGMSPEDVRSRYTEYLDGVLDIDFQAFKRGPFDDYTAAQLGCDGFVSAPGSGGEGGIEFHSTMDCSSTDVLNYFPTSTLGSITWTFTVTPEQSGTFVINWSPALSLTLLGCHPPSFEWDDFADLGAYSWSWSPSFDSNVVILAPGQYSLEWEGDFGSTLDFEMLPPCTFETGGCAPGQQCTIWNECRSEVATPASLGEPCTQDKGDPLTCEVGSRCVGNMCIAECDATQACVAGQGCSRTRICGAICDLLAQDCMSGFSCLPSSDVGLHASGLGVCTAVGEAGLFADCDRQQSECEGGLSCELPGSGTPCEVACCVPFCDPGAAEPNCPDGTPHCDPILAGPVGVCRGMPPS